MKRQYCLTEIPKDLLKFSKIKTNEVYDNEYWKGLMDKLKIENEQYEKKCEAMCIDPESGKSTMIWEERNKEFTL